MTDRKPASSNAGIGRRKFLKATGSIALAAPFVGRAWAAGDKSLTVRDPGGPVGEAYKKAYFDPFLEATGIEVTGVQAAHGPTGEIKAMVEAGNYAWDGALLGVGDANVLAAVDYLEPITGSAGANADISNIPAEYRTDHIVGANVYATVMAYRTDTMGDNPPTNYTDFWNFSGMAGSRAIRKSPWGTLEQALMADGVPLEEIYPLDLDRAFKNLDRIKGDVDIWWTGGAQTSQLLKTGEVDVLPTWNNRAQTAIDDGAPVKIVWDGAMASYAGFSILKGGPKVEQMREFVQFTADPKQQAEFSKHLSNGPTNPDAFQYIDPARAEILPTNPKYASRMFSLDSNWWGDNKDLVTERFETWLLS